VGRKLLTQDRELHTLLVNASALGLCQLAYMQERESKRLGFMQFCMHVCVLHLHSMHCMQRCGASSSGIRTM
jgi:hypothetical protein